MSKNNWNINNMEKTFADELDRAGEYLKEKKKITPKPKEIKKLTTLSDREERILLSEIETKEEVIETLCNFKINPGAWQEDIKRITLEVAALQFRLQSYMIENKGV